MDIEKFTLGWSTFHNHLLDTNNHLFHQKSFTDITLVSDDLLPIEAHKFILSSSSCVLQKLLQMDLSPKPVLFLRGIKNYELQALMQFLYLGETSIGVSTVERFLKIAKDLEIKKFMENDLGIPGSFLDIRSFNSLNEEKVKEEVQTVIEDNNQANENDTGISVNENEVLLEGNQDDNTKNTDSVINDVTVKEKKFTCPYCLYKANTSSNYHRHVRNVHQKEVQTNKNIIEENEQTKENDFDDSNISVDENEVFLEGYNDEKIQNNDTDTVEEKKFKCEECPYVTKNKGALRTHIKSIHLMEKFPCPHCPYKATQRCNYYRHIRTRHQID